MGFNSAFNPLNAELNPTCHLLALLGAHHIFYISGLRVKGLIRIVPILVAARSEAWVCGRSPAETAGSNPTVHVDTCLL